ncbi:hypothetical protein D7D52_20120 [Nocardia yunnanensis]|uniref:Uncharacterized protein n=1 Tax=Nocardia yunnanensis TaxID=2382165 RepID=A0A386ZF67_9NOCA|nr:hypothetical protein [Nocardia yunnanensis]AYF75764.1 hypothetical protein D7D52_20120 [Nocardia yunnanensis]
MTIYTTDDWCMTSDRSHESAVRVADGWTLAWRCSWLPDRLLTRAQALAAMVLAEIVADGGCQHDERLQGRVIASAGELGIPVEQAVFVLSRRRSA